MQDDELFALMKKEMPYLADDGFSDRVLESLPEQRRFRARILSLSFGLAIVLAFGFWVMSSGSSGMSAIASPLVLSAATVAFWSFIALFAFVSVDEGVFEI
ncbi:MAG: DUF5056 domain-containing protein [Proteobacteria bacterium]|nr:MAG: DUF5056 domain-containing protein [Pseudomonadota bacterium]